MDISEIIRRHSDSGYYSFHTPGHKGLEAGYLPRISDDITELIETDDLHAPSGMIRESMELAAKLYGSRMSYYSTGGSTAANMAAINACTEYGDRILVCGSCHVSVRNIALIKGLELVEYIPEPITDAHRELKKGVDKSAVEELLKENPDVRLIFVTSPSYEGIVSDISGIASVAKKFGKILIVDEAHGAHLALSELFPKSALHLGADIVINSLHKTLPVLTGGSIIHTAVGSAADDDKLKKSLLCFLSTSPSYLMLASMDSCIRMLSKNADALFLRLHSLLNDLYGSLKELKNIKLLDIGNELANNASYQDISRLVILSGSGLSGHGLYSALRNEYYLELEKSTDSYVIGITTIADSESGIASLKSALSDIDYRYESLVRKYADIDGRQDDRTY